MRTRRNQNQIILIAFWLVTCQKQSRDAFFWFWFVVVSCCTILLVRFFFTRWLQPKRQLILLDVTLNTTRTARRNALKLFLLSAARMRHCVARLPSTHRADNNPAFFLGQSQLRSIQRPKHPGQRRLRWTGGSGHTRGFRLVAVSASVNDLPFYVSLVRLRTFVLV